MKSINRKKGSFMDAMRYALLMTIMKKGYAKRMLKEGKKQGVVATMQLNGRGTVNPEMFEALLGLTYDPERDVIFSVVPRESLFNVKEVYTRIGQLRKKNTGIMVELKLHEIEGFEAFLNALEGN